MPRTKANEKEMSTEVRKILNALKFVSVAQEKGDNYFTSHVHIENGRATCTDAVVTASCPIATPLHACPQTDLFMKALQKCGHGEFSLTSIDDNEVEISSGSFKANIPAVREILFSEHGGIGVDICEDASKKLHDFIGGCKKFLARKHNDIHRSSVLFGSHTGLVFDGETLAEVMHPLGELPREIILPREFIMVMRKAPTKSKRIRRVEIGENNLTVYLEGDRWVSTRLYDYGWPPGIRQQMNMLTNPNDCVPVSDETRDMLSTLADFGKDNRVYFNNDTAFAVATNEKRSGEFNIENLGVGSFSNKAIKTIAPMMDVARIVEQDMHICLDFYCNNPMLRGRVAEKLVDEQMEEAPF